jgi:acetoin utilization deacetylase AcuC-like enzyme
MAFALLIHTTTILRQIMATGWVWHERYMWHDTGSGAGARSAGGWIEPATHIEHPATKRRLHNLAAVSGILDELTPIRPQRATPADLETVHDADYVAHVERVAADGGGLVGENVPIGRDSYEIALLSAGGALAAVEAILSGEVANAYALIRPPGHHAESRLGRGFCTFNNCAIAARRAQARGTARVAILDWDVHHGNGAQEIFWNDASVLTISVHQDRLYPPDSGDLDELGGPEAHGTNLNVPLPPGCGEGAYLATFEQVVVPALERFAPDLLIVASGYDAAALDPLGRMNLRSHSFRRIARSVLDAAQRVCDGRVLVCHEGGYSEAYVPFCGLAVIEELAGVRTDVTDPYFPPERELAYDALQPHQADVVDRAAALVQAVPAPA